MPASAQRERGASWEDIGAALKTTRQATHERFVEAEREWAAAHQRQVERVDTSTRYPAEQPRAAPNKPVTVTPVQSSGETSGRLSPDINTLD